MDTSDSFTYRYGRRFLRDTSNYPQPVDLTELHRQHLRTLLFIQVFGSPFCSSFYERPKKILEIACGSASWSSLCHQYLKSEGHESVSFTGLDIAPLAPDLRKQGVKWQFVQHDLRKGSLPFKHEEFDLIFVNQGMTIVAAAGEASRNPFTWLARYLTKGGMIEFWDCDCLFRCLSPNPPGAPGTTAEDAEQASRTATYTFSAITPFAKPQNNFIHDYNIWVEKALLKFSATATPCALMMNYFANESDIFDNVSSRRIAIPFGPIRWEREASSEPSHGHRLAARNSSTKVACATKRRKSLTAEQAAIRRAALDSAIGYIESLEPLLRKESMKSHNEWDRWWNGMTASLLGNDGTASGECLEVIACWAHKR